MTAVCDKLVGHLVIYIITQIRLCIACFISFNVTGVDCIIILAGNYNLHKLRVIRAVNAEISSTA